ncbi:MAG: hypothetical protein ACT6RF_09120 [Allorhizobium sp.]|uniref:hypothetical protein n=1 Tax=Allorhizobium sp. TaxID=633478 RepID=UPI004034B7A2
MIRLSLLLAILPSIAWADLSSEVEDHPSEPPALSRVAVPCLRQKDARQYVVTWAIRNTVTGERHSVGSQEVRLRC